MQRKDCDHYVLSTGREFHANLGIIGIAQQSEDNTGYCRVHGYELGEGLDSSLDADEQTWTLAEKEELADYMIEQWQSFRAAAQAAQCESTGHEWGPWFGFHTIFTHPPIEVEIRRCHQCDVSEEREPVRRSEVNANA
jgi:hypothetical protein